MRKSDLKTGMKVVTRDAGEFIFLKDVKHGFDNSREIFVCPNKDIYAWTTINGYNDDLTCKINNRFDIVKVFIPGHPYDIFYENSGWELIWYEKSEKEIELENLILKLNQQLKETEDRLNEIKTK